MEEDKPHTPRSSDSTNNESNNQNSDIELRDVDQRIEMSFDDEDEDLMLKELEQPKQRKAPAFVSYLVLAFLISLVFANLGGMAFWYNKNAVSTTTTIDQKVYIAYLYHNPTLVNSTQLTKWNNKGWNVTLIDENTSKKHPYYNLIQESVNPQLLNDTLQTQRLHSLLGASIVGGGLLSDLEAEPIDTKQLNLDDEFKVIQAGKFYIYGTSLGFNNYIAQIISKNSTVCFE
ncbi:heptaprenyl diphosphate synthase component 2 [Acrasis kona]|uniref:Heptaprenyl diphosphate synthase component 2 n=1 Tax=Acrasis kona TaxID=1008807 RepID=A0AAW2YNE1_9EUKA